MLGSNKSKIVCCKDVNKSLPKILEEELTCAICLNIWRDPLMTPCRHTYCRQCIGHSLRRESSTCPNCRTIIKAQSLAKPSLSLINILDNLEVYCDYRLDGCKTTLSVEEMDRHLNECPFNPNRFERESDVDYAMFGTFKTHPKTIEFKKDGITLTNVMSNGFESYSGDIRFTRHTFTQIEIPFIGMQELIFCSDQSKDLLFIKPTYEINLDIQDSMYLRADSPNGLKFDIRSKDSREHYLIVVLKEKVNSVFVENLNKYSKDANPNIRFSTLSRESGRDLLLMSKTRMDSLGTSPL